METCSFMVDSEAEMDAIMAQVIVSQSEALPGPASDVNDDGRLCPAFLKFLECDVVVERLMGYINFREMKVFSTLSKAALKAVRRTTEFSKRSRFNIKRSIVASQGDLRHRFPFSWKHLSYDVSLPLRVVDLFADKLTCAESLFLYYDRDQTVFGSEQRPSIVVKCCLRIHKILSKTRCLRELQLDAMFLKYPLDETFSSWKVQQSIGNIESLIVNGRLCQLNHLEATHLQQNLMEVSCCPLKLKRLVIRYNENYKLDSISKLVEASKETLEELGLGQNVWRLGEMAVVRCPKLQRLTADVHADNLKAFADFVQIQPLLQELHIKLTTFLPVEDLELFERRLLKIRKFQFDIEEIDDGLYDTEAEGAVDWSFLRTMTVLENFEAKLPRGGCGPQMIECLPEKVTKLKVSCHKRGEDFWSRDRHLESFSGNVGELLGRFKHLTHLSLIRCFDAVNDVGLQSIIKTCHNLMELRFGSCPNLSDFGISGVSENDIASNREPGVPLTDLKALVGLSISDCDLLSTACVLNVIRFKSLEWFDFHTSQENGIQDKEQFVSQLRKQNLRLVSFRHNGIIY